MASKHTPGPWRIDPEHPADIVGPDGRDVATTALPGEHERPDEERFANARILVSALAFRRALRKIAALYAQKDAKLDDAVRIAVDTLDKAREGN